MWNLFNGRIDWTINTRSYMWKPHAHTFILGSLNLRHYWTYCYYSGDVRDKKWYLHTVEERIRSYEYVFAINTGNDIIHSKHFVTIKMQYIQGYMYNNNKHRIIQVSHNSLLKLVSARKIISLLTTSGCWSPRRVVCVIGRRRAYQKAARDRRAFR